MANKRTTKTGAEKAPNLTFIKLVHFGAVTGFSASEKHLAGYVDAINDGLRPDPAVERLIANALSDLIVGKGSTADRSAAFLEALGLKRKQGQERSSVVERRQQAWAVVDFEDVSATLQKSGAGLKDANAEAVRLIALKHNIAAPALRKRIRDLKKEATHVRKLREAFRAAGFGVTEKNK